MLLSGWVHATFVILQNLKQKPPFPRNFQLKPVKESKPKPKKQPKTSPLKSANPRRVPSFLHPKAKVKMGWRPGEGV